ncbi:uncharacterized protein LOC135471276 isoform X2 [Liolophura sinensis]|uniref:uncharacterized protein LOC135471276 isoform X2 n=1 Tax=Liolophura sinensis TaxID=3198878 RepID=UPI00315901B2
MLTRVLSIFVQAFVMITASSENCEINTHDERLKPVETLELVAGEMLHLKCTAPQLLGVKNLTFSWNNFDLSEYTKTFPEERRAELRVENTVPFAGVSHVYCGYGGLQDCGKLVLIGYRPVKPQNIRCVSQALKDMVCTWDQVKGEEDLKILTNWTLSYRIGESSASDADCPYPNRTSCQWKSISSEKHNQALKWDETYHTTVIATNKLGTANASASFIPRLLVKPNQVPVKAGPQLENRSLPVTMEIPHNLEGVIKQFEYSLNATCLSGRNESDRVIHGTGSGPVSFRLDNLMPNSKYLLSGKIKPNGSGYWSDPYDLEIETQEAAPENRPSEVAFTQCRGDSRDKRRVDVYWQYLDSIFSNGKITHYRARVTSSAGTWTKQTTELFSPMTFDDLNMTDNYDLEVAASTLAGWGPYSWPVQLLPLDQELPLAADVIAESETDEDGGVSVNVSWTSPSASQASHAKVYVCSGHIERPMDVFLAKCEGDIRTEDVEMSTETSRHWLDVRIRSDRDVVIGVALNISGVSGGITWAECLADRNTEPSQMRGVSVLDVETNAAVVQWNMMSCEVQIRGYQISYWPVTDTSKQDCEDGIKQDFRGGRKTLKARLNNLDEATKYTMCARALTASGKYAPWSETFLGETITPPPVLMISLASVAVVLLILCIIGVGGARCYIQKQIAVQSVPEVQIEETTQNYTYDDYTTVDGYEATPAPGDNQAGAKRDSGHGSMSRSSESSTESCQPAAGTREHSSSAESTAAVRLPRTEAVQATVRQTCRDRVTQSRDEETEAANLLPSSGYVLETSLRKTEHQPMPQACLSDESRETTRLLAPSAKDEGSLHGGTCADVYDCRPNDLAYVQIGSNLYTEGNLSDDENLMNNVIPCASFTANEICEQRKGGDSDSDVDTAWHRGERRLHSRPELTDNLIPSRGDNSSDRAEAGAYCRFDTNVYAPSSSGGGMDSYSRFMEESLGDADFHRNEIHAATNSSDTMESYSRFGACPVINSRSNSSNSAFSSNSMASAHFEQEGGDKIPSGVLTYGPSTSSNCADNGIAPYSRLRRDFEISADSDTPRMHSNRWNGQAVQLPTDTCFTQDATGISSNSERGIGCYTRFDKHPIGTPRATTSTTPANVNDLASGHNDEAQSSCEQTRLSNTRPPTSDNDEWPSDSQSHSLGNPPRFSGYPRLPLECRGQKSAYQPHPPEPHNYHIQHQTSSQYERQTSGIQAQPSGNQVQPSGNQAQTSGNQTQTPDNQRQPSSQYGRHTPGIQAQPSDYQPHPFDYQLDPSEYHCYPSDYQRHPSEYQRHPPNYQRHSSNYQHNPSDYQRHPSEYQCHPSDYQRQPSEYQRHPFGYQRHSSSFLRHPSDYQRRPSEYQRHPSEDQHHPSEYQRHPSDYQRHLLNYQPHPSDYQRHQSECQRHPPDYQPRQSEYHRHPSEYQRHPPDYQCHLSNYQPHASDYQRHLSECQRHLSDYQRHPSDYQPHPSDYQPHPSEFERHSSEYERHQSEYEHQPSDFQYHSSDFQRLPSDSQCPPFEYQGQLYDCERQPRDHPRQLSAPRRQLYDNQHDPSDYKRQRPSSDYQRHASEHQPEASEHHSQQSADYPSSYSRFSACREVTTANQPQVYVDLNVTKDNPKNADRTSVKLEKGGNVLYSACDVPISKNIAHFGAFAAQDLNCNNRRDHKGGEMFIDDLNFDILDFDHFLQDSTVEGVMGDNESITVGGGENSAVGGDGRSAVGVGGSIASGGGRSITLGGCGSIASGDCENFASCGCVNIASGGNRSSTLSDSSSNCPSGDNANSVWVQSSRPSSPTAKDNYCVKETVL